MSGTTGTVRAVDGVSLEIGEGEVLGLVGESGCGKSTLGRGILGLLPEGAVTDGEVLFGGRNLVGMSDRELRKFLTIHDPTALVTNPNPPAP